LLLLPAANHVTKINDKGLGVAWDKIKQIDGASGQHFLNFVCYGLKSANMG